MALAGPQARATFKKTDKLAGGARLSQKPRMKWVGGLLMFEKKHWFVVTAIKYPIFEAAWRVGTAGSAVSTQAGWGL